MEISAASLWAKLERDAAGRVVRWHSLIDHSADVAAVAAALLRLPTWRSRLAKALGTAKLSDIQCERLAAVAFLHDIGKANRGFRARVDAKADNIGHIRQLAWVLENSVYGDKLYDVLGIERLEDWFSGSTLGDLWSVLLAHHGKPGIDTRTGATAPNSCKYWKALPGSDPIADLAPMRVAMERWFEAAFAPGDTLEGRPAFDHTFAGLLMLADWLGSDTTFFPMANGDEVNRMVFTRKQAADALRSVGLDVEARRAFCQTDDASFAHLFAVASARPIQQAATGPSAQCVVLEAETGSGKTEAALWRFVDLFRRGEVDGLYFALPTRVAATQMFRRVQHLCERLFPAEDRPSVVLAVPGQVMADDARGHALPDFGFEWDDLPTERQRSARWAAEHPKRFLAAQIAVGTIDQALLSAISTKHAHLRGTALLRHLLVVDEVHASDHFQEKLLSNLLRGHLAAGGHALLLSATLGAAARARLLDVAPPPLAQAERIDYPALSWAERGQIRIQKVQPEGRIKSVQFNPRPWLDAPAEIAQLARRAAENGAKVLIIRNTVAAAVATQTALEALGEHAADFRVRGVSTLHHGRFAAADRRLLDAEVEARLGKASPAGAAIIVGTQTLEVSLDLDADLLITDLCPVDVLLQRIGRLHRHAGRARPEGYQSAQAVVLTPTSRDLLAAVKRRGHGFGFVYTDPRILEATWRLIEQHAMWDIPAMNRMLVERATHPEVLEALEAEWRSINPDWRRPLDDAVAGPLSQRIQADQAILDRSRPFSEFRLPENDGFATRLGAKDRLLHLDGITGPFGLPIGALRVPHFLAPDSGEAEPVILAQDADGLTFSLGGAMLHYGRLGLRRVSISTRKN